MRTVSGITNAINASRESPASEDVPRTDRRARRREATQTEILEAAWVLVRENGVAALSMRELGTRVGMQAQSLYSYFASKNMIVDAMFAEGNRLFSEHMAPCLERFDAAQADGPALVDAMHATARAFFDFCVSDPARYQLMFQRTIPGFEPSPASYALAAESLDRFASRWATLGIDARGVDLVTAVMAGLTDQQLSNDPGGDRWARLVDEGVDMLIDHLVPRLRKPAEGSKSVKKGK